MSESIQTVPIPGGLYRIGSAHGRPDEMPEQVVAVGAFEMDRFPVTVSEAAQALERHGLPHPKGWEKLPPGRPDVPATRITATEASRVARLLGKRLPSENEWEIAAGLVVHDEEGVPKRPGAGPLPFMNAQQALALGLSAPSGLIAIVGLVWQWTASDYDWYDVAGASRRFPFAQGWRVVRGGLWSNYDARASFRSFRPPESAFARVGFRCVRSVDPDHGCHRDGRSGSDLLKEAPES
jgi:formylglycine-generating enzyme required for sulfatase activity